MEVLVFMDFMEQTVKMELQAFLVCRASLATQECLELLVRKEHLERLAHRERVELLEAQDHLHRLVPQVINYD